MERVAIITVKHTSSEVTRLVTAAGRADDVEDILTSGPIFIEGFREEGINELQVLSETGHDVIVGIFYNKQLQYFKELLHDSNLTYELVDITELVIFDQFDMEKELGDWVHTITRSHIDQFINEHLTQDLVLDKINRFGIESLTIKDKSLLTGEQIEEIFSGI